MEILEFRRATAGLLNLEKTYLADTRALPSTKTQSGTATDALQNKKKKKKIVHARSSKV